MGLRHGVLRAEDGTTEFFWLGNRIPLEEFNRHILEMVAQIQVEVDAVALGMDLGAAVDAGKISLAKLEAVDQVLRLPLCAPCRKLIGG